MSLIKTPVRIRELAINNSLNTDTNTDNDPGLWWKMEALRTESGRQNVI